MPKSKYPQALDTSSEIPVVRDNILEVGSDVINSLRSAIFNIERTLGINPQGTVGQTLSDRLNHVLDSSGNIKSEALQQANVLSGPILDNDVSKVAAIQENKLRLDYPTSLLQSEISILNNEISSIISKLEELNTEFASHVNPHALNRHTAKAISINDFTLDSSSISEKNVKSTDLQDFTEKYYSQHLNYSGEDISAENSSHLANQIFFDNSSIVDLIDGDSVQEAIEDLSALALNSQINHQDLMHSNGILKTGKIILASDSNIGQILDQEFDISFSQSSGQASGITNIIISNPFDLNDFNLKKSDIFTIIDSSDVDLLFAGQYEIESFETSTGKLTSVNIYGLLGSDSTSSTVGTISKNIKNEINQASLLISVREEADLTSAKTIQIANPNAVKVISNQIRPLEITTSKRFLGITIDQESTVILDLYNGSVTKQSIDSIISRINEQVAENAYNFLAYRVDYEQKSSELAIVYNIPDTSESTHTITLSRETDNGIDAAGFSEFENEIISSEFGSQYFINGASYQGLEIKLDSSELSFGAGTNIISTSSSGINFLEVGIKKQDLIIIINASNSNDDGTYVIESVNSTQIILSNGQLPSGFAGTSQDITEFKIYHNTASFDSIIFDEVGGGFGSILGDVFLNSSRNVFIDKRIEYLAPIQGSDSLITLIDFTGDITDKVLNLNIIEGTDLITLILDSGEEIEVVGNDTDIWIQSGSYNVKLKFNIPSVSELNNYLNSLGTNLLIDFFGFQGVNQDSNLLLARVPFNNFNGRVSGANNNPRILSTLSHGNIGINEISNLTKEILVNQPISDLRNNGIIYGLEVIDQSTTDGFYSFTVKNGIGYIKGKRIELEEVSIVTDIDSGISDKVFIAVDYDGLIRVEICNPTCQTPFEDSEVCLLATLEFDGVTLYNYDLRLFISNLDYKILNSITVSPVTGMGHFSDFGKAIQYARRFSQTFTKAGNPTVHLKSGLHEVIINVDKTDIIYDDWIALSASIRSQDFVDAAFNSGLMIDFPLNIVGEGNSSELNIIHRFEFADITYDFRGAFGLIGSGYTSLSVPLNKFTSGEVVFEKFKLKNCRMIMPDLNIDDGATSYFFKVSVNDIIFDMTEFDSNPFDDSIGPRSIAINEIDDISSNKGNLSIQNCIFMVEAAVSTRSIIALPDATRAKNFSIVNNFIIGADSSSNIRFLSEDIWNFTDANSGSNITITGNLTASNLNVVGSGSAPNMIVGKVGWGDRVSRSLNIGGNLSVEEDFSCAGDGVFTGSVESSSYNYGTTYTRRKNIFFETFSHTALGASGAGTTISSIGVNGREWQTIEFGDNTTDIMKARVEVLAGEILDDITIVFATEDPSDAIFGGFSLRITSEDAFGTETVEQAYTSMGSVSISSQTGNQTTSNLNLAGANNKYYIISLKRTITTGFAQHMMYILYTTTLSDVQALGGLS